MPYRKLLIILSIFHATVNTLYLVRFFGVFPPDEVVYGYAPWFMSFALPNITFTLLSWVLVCFLLRKIDLFTTVVGLVIAGGLIFHALNGLMFGFYSGSFKELTTFNAIFEIAVYVYGLSLATFFIMCFGKAIKEESVKC